MGRYLQVRVSAATWKPEDLEKAWPRLTELVWPNPAPAGAEPRGVLELVEALHNLGRFGDVPEAARPVLERDLPEVLRLKADLDQALADWKAAEANTLSLALEEALAGLDKALASG